MYDCENVCVHDYHSAPHNISEVRSSGLQSCETLKSHNTADCQHWETISAVSVLG